MADRETINGAEEKKVKYLTTYNLLKQFCGESLSVLKFYTHILYMAVEFTICPAVGCVVNCFDLKFTHFETMHTQVDQKEKQQHFIKNRNPHISRNIFRHTSSHISDTKLCMVWIILRLLYVIKWFSLFDMLPIHSSQLWYFVFFDYDIIFYTTTNTERNRQ